MIFNSKSEAFGLVILKSLSAGTPVFINSILFDRLEIFDSNSNGIIPYNSNSDLYFKIENNKKHAQQGRSFIEKKYSWDAITDLYIKEL
jgi:glycosyltransferase involved in cell wall biosynthesis